MSKSLDFNGKYRSARVQWFSSSVLSAKAKRARKVRRRLEKEGRRNARRHAR